MLESQNFDWNNSPKTVCRIIIESIQIICVSLVILALTVLTYLGLYNQLSKLTMAAPNVTVSSEGPAAEMYSHSMGQYKILRDIYRNNRAVYQHVDREDRFIIFARTMENGSSGNFWFITNGLEADRGFIRRRSEGEVILPEYDWQYIKKCKASR